jgi:hypothetical protein
MPKMPGSRRVDEDIALIGSSRFTGDAVRTADLSRRQRIHHEPVMPTNPHAQIPNRTAGRELRAGGAVGKNEAGEAVNGSLTSSMTMDRLEGAVCGAVRHAK